MACFAPIKAWYGRVLTAEGKRPIVFKATQAWKDKEELQLPCGQCIGCRLERSRQWALRCMHEKKMYRESAFCTLTYADAHLPSGGSLVKRDLQIFMKKLRHRRENGIRFFACGEYGETTHRPHYHLLLLNTTFSDLKMAGSGSQGQPLYVSAELDGMWQKGICRIGKVDFDSCAYVARYCLKKVNGKNAEAHYNGRTPEFTVMSRRPGIGFEWFRKYKAEAYKHDSAIYQANECSLPRYYDSKYEIEDGKRLRLLKVQRKKKALLHADDNTPARRKVKEEFETKKQAFFKRTI